MANDEDDVVVVGEVLPERTERRLVEVAASARNEALEKYQRFHDVMELAMRLLVQRTKAQDWIDFGDGKLMLDGKGACRIIPFAPWITIEITEHWREEYGPESPIPYAYMFRGDGCVKTGPLPEEQVWFRGIEGGRGPDLFFTQNGKIKPNPIHVKNAAQTAFVRRMLTAMFGLGGLLREDLVGLGMDPKEVAKVRVVERKTGEARHRPAVGQDTDESRKVLKPGVLEVEKTIARLVPERELWPALLYALTVNEERNFPGRISLHDLTENSASFILSRLQQLDPETAIKAARDAKAAVARKGGGR